MADSTTFIHSFPPLSDSGVTRLILGSMPGKASLAADQYYAHPRNYFWRIVGVVLGIPNGLRYEARCEALNRKGVAVWDVLKTCTRSSSLDSDILESSIVPNDFVGFLCSHPEINAIFFNGAKAEQIYRRHVQPKMPDSLASIRTIRLPSTSPANASVPFKDKLEQWGAITDQSRPMIQNVTPLSVRLTRC
jgi:TDG/mug DNA glycosylase family protein